MKYLLAASQIVCLGSLLVSTPGKYRITAVYLCLAIPATLALQIQDEWLRAWYALLIAPVAFLRVAAGVEISHRQTEGFLYWGRLTGSAFLIGYLFALGTLQAPHSDFLRSMVEVRRFWQIWLGAVFLVIESFWIKEGGGIYRRADQVALIFGVIALNHAAVSAWAALVGFSEVGWPRAQSLAMHIDSAGYLVLSLIFLRFQAVPRCPEAWR